MLELNQHAHVSKAGKTNSSTLNDLKTKSIVNPGLLPPCPLSASIFGELVNTKKKCQSVSEYSQSYFGKEKQKKKESFF
jgi:hypothetical protein